MRRWVTEQVQTQRAGPVVIIDPDGIVRDDEVRDALSPERLLRTADWWSLRRYWERHGRHAGATRAVFVVTDPAVHADTDLPWDIARAATTRRIRTRGDGRVRRLLHALSDEDSDALAGMLTRHGSPSGLEILAELTGVEIRDLAHRGANLRIALRIYPDRSWSPLVGLALDELGEDPVVVSLLAEPPDLHPLQRLWDEWVAQPDDAELSLLFEHCRTEIVDIFLAGALKPPVAAMAALPAWARIGTRESSPDERVRTLLEAQPETPAAMAPFEAWLPVAMWWGRVRNELAQVVPVDVNLADIAWSRWDAIDTAFLAWLRTSYGRQLTRSWSNGPVSLDRIQPFLASRAAGADRILLLIFDGMGFTLWTQIHQAAQLNVLHATGALAMLPTLTEISRQAIAAGCPPIDFPDSLFTLSRERERWEAAWSSSDKSCTWLRVDGEPVDISDVPLGQYDIIGLVISATDKQMHSADLLGDAMLHSAIATWLRSGFLNDLVSQASDLGYETWVTADHGSLECVPEKGENEGEYVGRQGTRHRRYVNKTLRDTATAEGIVLETIPGLPEEYADRILFAPGRISWKRARISHGGLSIDEVIVPFAQIEAL